jgi:hypothetical protein
VILGLDVDFELDSARVHGHLRPVRDLAGDELLREQVLDGRGRVNAFDRIAEPLPGMWEYTSRSDLRRERMA